jgi:hypothetical protein
LITIHVLLSLAVLHGLLVHQMDVKTAFLNKELEGEIYMTQPDEFVVKGQEENVCKLMSHPVLRPNQMLIVCMPRIKLSYIRSECKHRIPMSLL